ncbi:MAG: tetratricopeptide repeat protein [Acidobacteriia bacterium]|nr:tetratricopeptide repeat protein [Terriglobia bacterium]
MATGVSTRAGSRAARSPARVAALLLAVALVAYLPALRAGFVWDDDYHVTRNAALVDAGGLARIWLDPSATPQYYPLTHTTFWIEHRLWGLAPLGYHLVNIVLHAGCAILLWRVLLALEAPGALLAAAVFALHPVHVESVAWITERKNVLSGALALGAILAWLRFSLVAREPGERIRHHPWRAGALSALLYVLALLSKSVTATLPGIAGLLTIWRRGRPRRREVVLLSAMLLAGAAAGLTTVSLERQQIGAEGPEWSLGPLERLLVAGRVPWFYLSKLAWPAGLSFVYPRWTVSARAPVAWLGLLATTAILAGLFVARKRIGAGPWVAFAAFLVALFPALGFFNVYPMRYSWVADHFQYLASAAPIALFAASAARAAARARAHVPPWLPRAVAAVLLLALGAATWSRAHAFRDEETLWRDTLARNPSAWMAHNNLAGMLQARGETEEAIAHLRETLRLKPDHAGARENLGLLLARSGRASEAIPELIEAVRQRPDAAAARAALAGLLAAAGRLGDAIAEYEAALKLDARDPDLLFGLANALARDGHVGEAANRYAEGLRIRPQDADAHYDLGTLLARGGRLSEGIAELEEAVRLRPGMTEARRNLEIARRLVAATPRP